MSSDSDVDAPKARPANKPFRFFDLPYELRLRVYELIFVFPQTLDLDPLNIRSIRPLLEAFLVSHRMHEEAYNVFYGRNTFRLFPTHGRFHHTKTPLLARLPSRYRAAITKVELRLGPSWTKPPRGWVADGRLGLGDAIKLRILNIFIEFDPAAHIVFQGYRNGDYFYTEFCVDVVRKVFALVPSISQVEFDAWESVSGSSPLLQGLLNETRASNKRITWGPARDWDKIVQTNLISFWEKARFGRLDMAAGPF